MAVSIALKNLFESRTKLIMSLGGVSLAILLILVLDGVFAGAIKRVTAYMDNIPYQIMVSQKGVKNLHMTTSFFSSKKSNQIEEVKGVKSVNPVLYSSDYLVKGNNRSVAYIIGYKPGKLGGPWAMAEGTSDITSGEIIIDEQIADKYKLKIGDKITTFGRKFKIAGFAKETVNIVNSIAFIRYDDFEKIRNLKGIASYDLVTVKNGQNVDAVIKRIRDKVKGLTVLTREEFSNSEKKVVSDMSIDIMRLMNSVAFLIGLAVLGLTVYTATLSKLKEYGILKAIGTKNGVLMGIVLKQALLSTFIGMVISIILALIISMVLVLLKSNMQIVLSLQSIFKILIGATIINTLASSIPVIKIAGLDPAEVFRR